MKKFLYSPSHIFREKALLIRCWHLTFNEMNDINIFYLKTRSVIQFIGGLSDYKILKILANKK